MEIRNCKRCGKVYSYFGGAPICSDCKEKDEEDFQKVKKYLYDNPGASMKEISEQCEVSAEKITRFLKEGRLEIKEGSNVILECESCGKSIRSGRFCADCSRQLEKDISRAGGAAVKPEVQKNLDRDAKIKGGMRYLKS